MRERFLLKFSFFFLLREEAALEMEGHFLVRLVYDDALSYDLVGAASKILSAFIFL